MAGARGQWACCGCPLGIQPGRAAGPVLTVVRSPVGLVLGTPGNAPLTFQSPGLGLLEEAPSPGPCELRAPWARVQGARLGQTAGGRGPCRSRGTHFYRPPHPRGGLVTATSCPGQGPRIPRVKPTRAAPAAPQLLPPCPEMLPTFPTLPSSSNFRVRPPGFQTPLRWAGAGGLRWSVCQFCREPAAQADSLLCPRSLSAGRGRLRCGGSSPGGPHARRASVAVLWLRPSGMLIGLSGPCGDPRLHSLGLCFSVPGLHHLYCLTDVKAPLGRPGPCRVQVGRAAWPLCAQEPAGRSWSWCHRGAPESALPDCPGMGGRLLPVSRGPSGPLLGDFALEKHTTCGASMCVPSQECPGWTE